MRLTNVGKEAAMLLKQTWDAYWDDEASQLGAALAFYTLFSIIPLLILLLAGFGFVLHYWDEAINVREELLRTVARQISPQFSRMLSQILETVIEQAPTATGIGLLTLLYGATNVFEQLDTSLSKIWRVEQVTSHTGLLGSLRNILVDRFVAFGMMLTLGLLLLVSMVLTGLTRSLLEALGNLPVIGGVTGFVAGLVITLLLNTIIFALLFKYLPETYIEWRDVLLGAALTAVLWEIAKRLFALYIERLSYASAYGAIGTLLALMVWVYLSSQVLFFGAEFTKVYARRFGSRCPEAKAAPATEEQSRSE